MTAGTVEFAFTIGGTAVSNALGTNLVPARW